MIGLFGGTFDPVHYGHLRTALEVMEQLQLDSVRMIPAQLPPLRDEPQVPAEMRAEMVRLAIEGLDGFVLDTRELEREGPSYTVDTLRHYRDGLGENVPLILIMGADAFARLPEWHQWERLIELAHIAVMTRPGTVLDEAAFPAGWLGEHLTESPQTLRSQPTGTVIPVPVTALDISATAIRSLLATGRSARFLLPDAVLEFIREQRLYQPRTGAVN
jgi:nicotinate-nucleotide adenylyltransferase